MKIRFGEIKIGEMFIAFGQEMIKINEYGSRITSLCGKQDFLFNKKDLVENYPWYTPAGLLVGYKGKVTFAKSICYCPYLLDVDGSKGKIFYPNSTNISL